MSQYAAICDEFYVNMNFNAEMDLPGNRETILHFFEQLRRRYPSMRNFYTRERAEFVLEEEKDQRSYRWATVDARRVCSGYVNPESTEEALRQHQLILELMPYALSVSSLDCESLNLMYGFDFTYRGNHNELVAEALGLAPAFDRVAQFPQATMVSYEPAIQFAIDDECRTQCRVSVETRTSPYHIRTGEFPEDQISVYVTTRRYGSLGVDETYNSAFDRLIELGNRVLNDYVVESILLPLQHTISIN